MVADIVIVRRVDSAYRTVSFCSLCHDDKHPEWKKGATNAPSDTTTGSAVTASHAVLCLLLGIEVLEARVDSPIMAKGPDCGGVVTTVPDMDRLWEHLLATLAGPLSVGRAIEWPPSMAAGGDEEACARLVAKLGLDEKGFNDAKIITMGYLFDLPTSRRAITAVTGALLERGALTGDEVRRVIAQAAEAETVKGHAENGKASDGGGDGPNDYPLA